MDNDLELASDIFGIDKELQLRKEQQLKEELFLAKLQSALSNSYSTDLEIELATKVLELMGKITAQNARLLSLYQDAHEDGYAEGVRHEEMGIYSRHAMGR